MASTGAQQLQRFSLVVCSRNGAAQLPRLLESVAPAFSGRSGAQLVLVDSASTDDTRIIMEAHAKDSAYETCICALKEPGLGRARNAGVEVAAGDWLFFTDDDCRLPPNFFTVFEMQMAQAFDYGGGEIHPARTDLDTRVACLRVRKTTMVPPGRILTTGFLQGANMFFHKRVFERIGAFNPHMGHGTEFSFEDIDMATRASLAGFIGVRIRGLVVQHDHNRRAGTPEADAVTESYDTGRGGYYASLLSLGIAEAFDVWRDNSFQSHHPPERLRREFAGAAAFLSALEAEPELQAPGRAAAEFHRRQRATAAGSRRAAAARFFDLTRRVWNGFR